MKLNVVLLALSLAMVCSNALRGKAHTKTKDDGYELKTDWNDRGQGNFVYLDRHLLDCSQFGGNRFINGFKLERNGDQIRFRYSCSQVSFNQNQQQVKFLKNIFSLPLIMQITQFPE